MIMISEIIGAVIGFLASFVAPSFKLLQSKMDNKQQLEIIRLQIENTKINHDKELQVIAENALTTETRILYKTFNSGIKWVDSLNSTVRPVISYGLFGIYLFSKVAYCLLTDKFYLYEFWGREDNMYFITIISFYFGQRAVHKIMS